MESTKLLKPIILNIAVTSKYIFSVTKCKSKDMDPGSNINFMDKKEIKSFWENVRIERRIVSRKPFDMNIDLDRSLAEITYDVILNNQKNSGQHTTY